MEQVKTVGDVASGSIVIATLANWLPAISAILTIAWLCIRIYETKTVQKWLGRGVQEFTDNDD